MSKFDLRDISERLTGSRDTEGVVFEFLGYLQSIHSDWRASLTFYEVSRDALVNVYQRQGTRLVRRDLTLPVDQLPARLVRKFFHPSAFFNHADRRSMLTQLFGASPSYEPDPREAPALHPVTALHPWQSCVCLPLADQEDILALLVIASDRKNAFGSKEVGEIIPVKSMAALALAQHLYRASRGGPEPTSDEGTMQAAAAEFQDHIRRLHSHAAELEQDNLAKARQLESLGSEIEHLDKHSNQYRQELERVKTMLFALEEQSAAATQHLTEAYSQLNVVQNRLTELQRTVTFVREVFQVLAQEHDPQEFSRTMVAWFCEHFGLERCSLMQLDPSGETLSMSAHRGIAPSVAKTVKVRIGQGIAGWVAHNRKPLFVRVRDEVTLVRHTDQDAYNSDSFICVPLVHQNKLYGVLNLSNKREGDPFDEMDLDRAMLAGSVLAMSIAAHETLKRAAATWS